MNDLNATLERCLDAAAEIHLRYLAEMRDRPAGFKGEDFNLLTIADTECDRRVGDLIAQAHPGHSIRSEESADRLRAGTEVEWIIDPIDGTINYAHGLPQFCIAIAVAFAGEVRLAAVRDSFHDQTYRARLGAGATLNDRPIHVSTTPELRRALVGTSFGADRRRRADRYLAQLRALLMRSHGALVMGTAALDICRVAAGQLDAYYQEDLSVWDWAASALIVREAGGRVTDYDDGGAIDARRQICASNGRIHEELLGLVNAVG